MAEKEVVPLIVMTDYRVGARPWGDMVERAGKTQRALMKRLFPKPKKEKNAYSLVEWNARRRRVSDLHLYAALGFFSPIEYEEFRHQMERWQRQVEREELSNELRILDDGNSTVYVAGSLEAVEAEERKRPTFSNLLRLYDFDKNENMLLYFDQPLKLIKNLSLALFMEETRLDREGAVSSIDELLCQNVPPANAAGCWAWMNRMVAGRPKAPMRMALTKAQRALQELNEFQIYSSFADICDYSRQGVVMQRRRLVEQKDAELVPIPIPIAKKRINTALDFLEEKGFISADKLNDIVMLMPSKRREISLLLKRAAVSAFLGDVAEAAPSNAWLRKMEKAFRWYFHDILAEVGVPNLRTEWEDRKTKEGVIKKVPVTHVVFVNMALGVRKVEKQNPPAKNVTDKGETR